MTAKIASKGYCDFQPFCENFPMAGDFTRLVPKKYWHLISHRTKVFCLFFVISFILGKVSHFTFRDQDCSNPPKTEQDILF